MTHFRDYTPEKYNSPDFEKIEEGIYRTKDPYGIVRDGGEYRIVIEPEQ